jgi:hypothetical protein
MPRLAAVIAKLLDRSAAICTMSHYAISSVNAPNKHTTKRESQGQHRENSLLPHLKQPFLNPEFISSSQQLKINSLDIFSTGLSGQKLVCCWNVSNTRKKQPLDSTTATSSTFLPSPPPIDDSFEEFYVAVSASFYSICVVWRKQSLYHRQSVGDPKSCKYYS